MQTLDADSEANRHAFEALTETFRELFAWLHTMAALHPMSLGALLRRFPEREAQAKYDAGEHVGAWAGVELARVYRQILADLRSHSRHSVSHLREIRCGFDFGKLVVSPNAWFCAEYARKTDYRPTGKMAVWIAGKIEELRRIKESRSQWRGYASIEILKGRLQLRAENEIDEILAVWFQADIAQGEALRRLDNLPVFGSADVADFKVWRQFVRNRVLTSTVVGEFDQLFPNSRRKLDGVIAATLQSAWQAVQRGGNVILRSCK